eukprot:Sspe_Gene.83258::Locus_54613_Transcript_1_1_Confidence_1.000_Length_637::g.83258::m.83258
MGACAGKHEDDASAPPLPLEVLTPDRQHYPYILHVPWDRPLDEIFARSALQKYADPALFEVVELPIVPGIPPLDCGRAPRDLRLHQPVTGKGTPAPVRLLVRRRGTSQHLQKGPTPSPSSSPTPSAPPSPPSSLPLVDTGPSISEVPSRTLSVLSRVRSRRSRTTDDSSSCCKVDIDMAVHGEPLSPPIIPLRQ